MTSQRCFHLRGCPVNSPRRCSKTGKSPSTRQRGRLRHCISPEVVVPYKTVATECVAHSRADRGIPTSKSFYSLQEAHIRTLALPEWECWTTMLVRFQRRSCAHRYVLKARHMHR